MKIKRAIKSAAKREQLKEVLRIAKEAQIHGLEIQELPHQMEECSLEKRGKTVIDSLGNHSITSLAYHFPIKLSLDDFEESKELDLATKEGSYVFEITKDTIEEAALVGRALEIKTEIPVVIHLFGFAAIDDITEEEKIKKLKLGEKRLLELKEVADFYSKKFGLSLIITRENNPPDHGKVLGLLDFHPQEIVETADLGIGTNLDLAHLWLTFLYYKNGRGEFPGVDLSKKIYPEINFEEIIALLAPSLKLVHLNDAGPGFKKSFEGLEIGKGNLPHSRIIPLICDCLEKEIMGTYEIKYGHQNPKSILKSDQFYRNLFKEKFTAYFT